MENNEIEKKIKELLTDSEFDALNLSLKDANIFTILSDVKKEIKHSNFIAYLLNPFETHGLNEVFLQAFIREVFSDNMDTEKRSLLDIADLDYSTVTVLREWHNIDILVIMSKDVFCIENKINIADHSGQLGRYRKIVEDAFPKHERHFIYLTPFGEDPKEEKEREYYHNISYETIVFLLESITKVYKTKMGDKVLTYINDYITVLNREILMSDELNNKAAKLYAKYADAIEFLYLNKPDAASELYDYFKNALTERGYVIGSKNKGYIRFTTKKLRKLIPDTGNGWPDKESFLFEIDYYWSDKNAVCKACISPCDDSVSEKILNAVADKPYYEKPKGSKWKVFYNRKMNFRASEVINNDKGIIQAAVNKILDDFCKVVDEIARDIENNYEA